MLKGRPGYYSDGMTGPSPLDVIVIGAGQAGLAAARSLVSEGLVPEREMLVLDANDGPGGAWRHRWDALTLGRTHRIADLPGMPFGKPDPREPASRAVARYYGEYERRFGLRVRRPARVTAVRSPEGPRGPLTIAYEQAGARRTLRSRIIISASGTWTRPFVPTIPGAASFRGEQLHTAGFTDAEHFRGRSVIVVGGGLSAVQFLLQLAGIARTTWATRRPPPFTPQAFDEAWGTGVEHAVRERTTAGLPPESVVRGTGIPMLEEYLRGVEEGILVSRGMFDRITPGGVSFPGGSAADPALAVPGSWSPFRSRTELKSDVIFWNTGFRAELRHLAPLRLRSPGGGIRMRDEVEVAADPRVLLVGYGSSASTVGAARAGRRAARKAMRMLQAPPP